jgi:glycosyltransferase involved in cell wall biosynthesis
MKITQISSECSSNGGVGTYVCNLLSSLQSAGHEVSIIHNDRNADYVLQQTQQFYLKDFDTYKSENEESTTQVLEILKSINPDVVHIQRCNNFYLESEIRKQFHTIKSLHDYDFCPSGNKFHHILQKECTHSTSVLCVPRMIYKRCHLTKRPNVIWKQYERAVDANTNNRQYKKLIVASEYVKKQALASGYSESQITVVPYYTKLPALNSSLPEQNTVLFVGRIVREKGLRKLLKAFKQLRSSAQLMIVGDGGDLPEIKHLSRRHGLGNKVTFTGWMNSDQKDELYRNSSVLVIPSVWPEPFGIVGVEAMSYAKPVVAFRIGGISEWLEDGKTGYLINPYDVTEMAKRIDSLLQQKELAREMGKMGRVKVERQFIEVQHVERLLETYTSFVDSTNLVRSHREQLYS